MTEPKPPVKGELLPPKQVYIQLGYGDEGSHTWSEDATGEWEPEVGPYILQADNAVSIPADDFGRMKKIPYTRDEMAADYFDPLEDRYSEGWNDCLEALARKYGSAE